MTNLDSIWKSRDIIFLTKVHIVKAMVFSSFSHIQMWELDHKEVWAPKNWCFQTVVLEKTWESRRHSTEIEPVNPKGNQPWIFFGRTDAEAPILWLPDVKSWLTGKDCDAGKDWEPAEKGAIEDEMAGWHHWRNGQTGRWWRTEKPGVLQSMGSQRVRHDLATEQYNSRWLSGKESSCRCSRHGFGPWSGRSPHAAGQSSPYATTTEPVLWSLGTDTTLEPTLHKREASAARAPGTATRA